ncbi:MAG: trigger factor [Candidatus Nealsonbacteria bacterium]|nr:trigger factor [Candidatus Nealsonbacteria bacterium]
MDFKISDKEKSKKEIEVTVSIEEMSNYFNRAVEKISSKIEIKGFRPGKAPKNIVEKNVGKEKIWHEATHDAIEDTYPRVIKESELFIISQPEIDIIISTPNNPFVYKATVSVLPEVKLPDYKSIAKKSLKDKKEIKVEKKEVEKILDTIRKTRAKTVLVNREVKDGDEVEIDFSGKLDGVDQEGIKGEKAKIIVGEKKFIQGFEEQLIGMKKGEEKTITVKMPNPQDGNERDIDFDVKVLEVYERQLPEINEEFAKSLGDFTNPNDLNKKIEENVKLEKEQKEKERLRVKIIEEIGKESSVDIPEIMIEREIDNMFHEFEHQLSQSGMKIEDYLKQIKKTKEEIAKDWEDRAKKRIMTALILQKIAKEEGVKVSEEEVQKESESYLNRIHDPKTKKELDIERLKVYIEDLLQNEKVFELLENSK